jgi:hypothetical protein
MLAVLVASKVLDCEPREAEARTLEILRSDTAEKRRFDHRGIEIQDRPGRH